MDFNQIPTINAYNYNYILMNYYFIMFLMDKMFLYHLLLKKEIFYCNSLLNQLYNK